MVHGVSDGSYRFTLGYNGSWHNETHFNSDHSLAQIAVQKRHNLGAGAAVSRAEGSSTGAGGDTRRNCPRNCVCVVGIVLHIAKGIRNTCGTLARRAPQEGHGLAACYGSVGAECCTACAQRDPLSAAHRTALQ